MDRLAGQEAIKDLSAGKSLEGRWISKRFLQDILRIAGPKTAHCFSGCMSEGKLTGEYG